jgi:(2Fe-2S) ferredoxin
VYSGVGPQDVAEIVREHLVHGRVVERLLFRKKEAAAPDGGAADRSTGPA